MRYRCDSKLSLQAALTDIQAQFAKAGYLEISTSGKRRTNLQNDVFWPWCREIAQARDDGTSEYDVAAEIKLEKAFTLRRANDPEFDDLLKRTIDKLWPEGGRYELAMALAKEIPCTSKLDAAAMSALLEWMQLHYWQTMQIRLEAK